MATRQTRAKDSDRTDTCQVLDSAFGEGQLSMEEHRQRVATATTAATLGELQSLVADLQTANAPVKSPSKLWAQPDLKKPAAARLQSGGWGMRAAVAAVLVLLGIGIGWGLYGNTSSPLSFTTDPGAKSDGIPAKVVTPPRQLQSLGGLNGLFEQMRQQFGDTMGYDDHLSADRAMLDRPDPEDERRKVMYDLSRRMGRLDLVHHRRRRRRARRPGEVRRRRRSSVCCVVPRTPSASSADVTTAASTSSPKDPTDTGPVTIIVYVSSDFGSGYIEMAGDGTVKQINYPAAERPGPEPESGPPM